ncbi:MAG: [Oscillospiraceae bacterium]|nr:[citrate (pro-3S)-lyase] ligase [Oscillospiraceae bacterium]
MYTESVKRPAGEKREKWLRFLQIAGLKAEEDTHQTVLVWDEGELIATGSRKGNLLKCIAVDPARQGEGLTASVLTALKQEAHREGHSHLFLYTKPRNRMLFEPLFFYPVAQTQNVLLMESRRDGIRSFLNSLEAPVRSGKIGAIVMNANPFTCGHQYLAETAAGECDHVCIFVLSEDRSEYSAADRMEMVKLGTAHLKNVTVLPTGPYLISEATFPKYFLKDRETAQREHYLLDLAVFTRWFVPHFGITHRYAGTEPNCVVTAGYNAAMEEILPRSGVIFRQIPRRKMEGTAVSASIVRAETDMGKLLKLVPWTTIPYLKQRTIGKGE